MALKGGERHFKLPNIGKVVLKIVLWCVCVCGVQNCNIF